MLNDTFLTAQRRRSKCSPEGVASDLDVRVADFIATHSSVQLEHSSGVSTPLLPHWRDIVGALPSLGEVSALTGSQHCVMEATGAFVDLRFPCEGEPRMVRTSGGIEVRFFFEHWGSAYATQEALTDGAIRRSLQFFDASGRSVHKVTLTPNSSADGYATLLERLAMSPTAGHSPDDARHVVTCPAPPALLDLKEFRRQWVSMRDTSEFHGLLRRNGLTRLDALHSAPADYASRISTASAHEVLSLCAQQGVPIRVIAGNAGAVQIHTGCLAHVDVTDEWISVGDRRFCLHLREDRIASAWLVKKPTVNGLIHSIELFDTSGSPIAILLGDRRAGRPEPCEWRQSLSWLTPEVAACAI